MTSAVITNFKNMLLLVGKVGSSDPTCPMNATLLGKFIDYMFNDQARVARIPTKYAENRTALNKIYHSRGSSYKEVLANRDRSVFLHMELFPEEVASRYKDYISWFSTFLASGMDDKHMEWVWRYIAKIDEQIP